MSYVIEPEPRQSLPVQGSAKRFPVNNIYCVGRNYADHAIEMGGDPNREPPFFFIKPNFAILPDGTEMAYPEFSTDVHHEIELVVAIGRSGVDVSVAAAQSHIFGYGVGVDMTRRDLQSQAKEQARPWEAGKSFVHAAPCSEIVPIEACANAAAAEITLTVNGEVRQQGNTNQMIWKIPEVISRLSTLFCLQAGDLIFTGTPAGVGPVQRGDQLNCRVVDLTSFSFTIGSA